MNTETPNHALQRTATAVTAPASCLRLSPTMQGPRQPQRSLSLGSLGVATFFFVNRAIILSAVVGTLLLFAAGCSSSQQGCDYCRRKHAYQGSLSRITFPTTRARIYTALPPAPSVRISYIDSPCSLSEHYVLDAARRCDATGGNYVDASGAVLPPF